MNSTPDFPRLSLEQASRDQDEAALLAQLAELLATTEPMPDLRDLAPAVRRLFPEPDYFVGCGSSHIWLRRATDPHRLALIR